MYFTKSGFKIGKLAVIWGPPRGDCRLNHNSNYWKVSRFVGLMWGNAGSFGLYLYNENSESEK